MWRILGILDDIVTLLGNLGWLGYVEMKCVSCNDLVLKLLSSLHVDQVESYRGNEVLIIF